MTTIPIKMMQLMILIMTLLTSRINYLARQAHTNTTNWNCSLVVGPILSGISNLGSRIGHVSKIRTPTFTLIDDHFGIRYGKTKKVQGAAHDAVRSIYCNQMNPYLCFGFNIRLIFICVNETMNSKFLLKNEYRLLFLIHVIISSQK